VPCRGDIFHALHKILPVVTFLENRAYAAIAARSKLDEHRQGRLIREYLKVTPYGKRALRVATAAITAAVRVMDNPADLINVAIEELVTVP
jgi:Domain of unknown function (DUF4158)